ncbi:MAG: AAA family ATPase [Micropepsaceae bacterium]
MYVLLSLIWFIAGVVNTLAWVRYFGMPVLPGEKRPARVPAPEATPSPAVEVETAPEALSAKLYRLSQPLESFGDSSAHPKELRDRSEFSEAVLLLVKDDVPIEVVTQYAFGANWTMACAALEALAARADGEDVSVQVANQIPRLRPWVLYFALEYLSKLQARPSAGAAVVGAEQWWIDNIIIPGLFQSYFTKLEQLGEVPEFGTWLHAHSASDPEQVENFLKCLNHPFATKLISALHEQKEERMDRAFLTGFGRFWTSAAPEEPLIEPPEWKDLLDAAERAILHTPPRSLIVRGEEKVGKTAFLKLLGIRLMGKKWTVFEAGGPELQAGQSYIGQLEERVRRLAQEVVASKRVIWYVPDILQMAVSGTHQAQTASILDQLQPALSAGRVIIISEATPAQLTQLVQLKPHLKGLFEAVPLGALSEARTLELAQKFVKRVEETSAIRFGADVVPLTLQLARQYLDPTQLPGIVFELIKLAFNQCAAQGTTLVTPRDIMVSLSQVTGLPKAILDADERVELAQVRRYFDERVMGQPEAVQHVVDRVAMLKAGLTDPSKPIGVFLFAGPTGTGKTELAKTLAQYLFGSTERMIRLDMSEFKNHDSISKIIGEAGAISLRSDSLINRVRKQPFSVVLLDEFEKAHPNVWDLFLQVFDDGRLTDANGSVADFRHCIIILTSNLGATVHQNSGLGFGERTDAFSPEQIMRAIGQSFRPEFVNRLDKVIVFQPLRRDLMREILQKELRTVLERRGIRNREWAVEWESSAIEFLLDKGFSAQLGARPLKRAIDQYLLAPLAATIVEHRVPEGDQFLFVRSDGNSIQVEFVDPDADRKPQTSVPQKGTVELAGIVLGAQGTEDEHTALAQELRLLDVRMNSDEWRTLADTLSLQMSDAAFWKKDERFETLARYALLDRVKAAAKTADALRERLEKSRDKAGRYSPQLMGRLARQMLNTRAGSIDAVVNAPVEAVLKVEIALEGGGTGGDAAKEWCDRISNMYRGWAAKRVMQINEYTLEGATYFAVSGFGAYRTLIEEIGLHVLETGEEEGGTSRCVARVRVAPSPPGELKAHKAARQLKTAVETVPASSTVVRRYRGGDAALVRDAKRGWRSGRFDEVMSGDFDLIGATAE